MTAQSDERHEPPAAYAPKIGIPPALLQRRHLAFTERSVMPECQLYGEDGLNKCQHYGKAV